MLKAGAAALDESHAAIEQARFASVAEATRRFYVPALDGIRALSFFAVFVSHASSSAGGFGVTIFFFLSGYLITTLLRLEYANQGGVRLRAFYARRALRIFPPFYIVLLLAALLAGVGLLPGGFAWSALLAQLAHASNYLTIFRGFAGQPAGTGVYWSLAVEEHFYLFFPAVFLLLQRLFPGRARAQANLLLCSCGAVLVWRVVLVCGLHAQLARTHLATDTRLDSILFGCALAIAGNPALDAHTLLEQSSRNALLCLGLGLLGFSLLIRASWFLETLRYTVQGIALTLLFVLVIRYPSWAPLRWLALPALRHIGELSFTLYLVHHVILDLVAAWLPQLATWGRALCALLLSLAFSEGMLRWVERPCARLRRHFAAQGRSAANARYGIGA